MERLATEISKGARDAFLHVLAFLYLYCSVPLCLCGKFLLRDLSSQATIIVPVPSSVNTSAQSVVIDEAENRLHAQKAIMDRLFSGERL